MGPSELTNDALDSALAEAILLDRADEIDALFAERSRRIATRQREIAASEAEWSAGGPVITVPLTRAQADRLEDLLPPSMLGLEVLATRVKGTAEELVELLDWLDEEAALELAMPGFEIETDEEEAFAERAVRRSVQALRRKILTATSP